MSTERELVEALTWIDHPSEFRVYWLTDSAGKILAEVGSTSIGGWYAVVGKTRLPHEYTTPGNAKLAAEAASKPSPSAAEVVLPELPEGEVMAFDRGSGRVLKRYTRAQMEDFAREAIALNRGKDAHGRRC